MDSEKEKQLEFSMSAMTNLFRENKVDRDTYCKMMVITAFEFANAGEQIRAASIISMLPLDYFKNVQKSQMEADTDYAYMAYSLALSMVQGGFVHLGASLRPTQAPAMA
jgi:hypothetical protein